MPRLVAALCERRWQKRCASASAATVTDRRYNRAIGNDPAGEDHHRFQQHPRPHPATPTGLVSVPGRQPSAANTVRRGDAGMDGKNGGGQDARATLVRASCPEPSIAIPCANELHWPFPAVRKIKRPCFLLRASPNKEFTNIYSPGKLFILGDIFFDRLRVVRHFSRAPIVDRCFHDGGLTNIKSTFLSTIGHSMASASMALRRASPSSPVSPPWAPVPDPPSMAGNH